MFRSYVTYAEFLNTYPLLGNRYGEQADVEKALASAAYYVGRDLRARYDLRRIYVPVMFDSLNAYEYQTKTSDHTATAIDPHGASRFVVLYTSGTGTFEVQGSIDGTNWVTLPSDRGNEAKLSIASGEGTYSILFLGSYEHLRYTVTDVSSLIYSPFVVDTAADELIHYRALMQLLEPLADDNAAREYLTWARERYAEELRTIRMDYDVDESGTIEEEESSRTPSVRAWR